MTTVQDILNFVETLAPASMKMEWDNVGLLCGRRIAAVNRILVALDPFEHVCQEAVERQADLLVTHHPLIFTPQRAVTDDTSVGRCIEMLCRHGISAVNAHTNLDCADGGVNDVLAQTLGLTDVEMIGKENLLRAGSFRADLPEFLAHVKAKLGCEGLRYVDGGKPVSKVAVGGGSCASFLWEVAGAGCDTFVTADVKYNQFWDAQEMGVNLIDAGHFQTENPVCRVLAEKIRSAFPQVEVILSEKHADCMKFY